MNISLAGRKILLIGGAGFIGHNLALKLTELNAEVTIIGRIQGVPSVLKRGFTAKYTGPVIYQFETWDLYDTIDILARNMAGGRPGPASIAEFADGYRLDLNVSIQPAIVRRGQYG